MSGIEKMNEEIARGPGRPRKFHEQFAAPVAAVEVQADAGLPQRPSRKPFGSMSLKLDYPQREGFHRHWFNDVPGRVDRAKEAGYEHVKSNEGKPVSRTVGTAEGGGALTAFLMEIPEEWYKQDMATEQNMIDEKEEVIRRGALDKAEGDNRYVPSQGISIKSGPKP
jgi:hypothetical protein